jgi:hypothetical protein
MNTTLLICLFLSFKLQAQDYVPFRNTLNEATYWFYEQEYDSACHYYFLAENHNLPFYCMESHLFSRSLWEVGQNSKALEVLQPNGYRDFFLSDTTFYIGLSKLKRIEIANGLLQEAMYRYEDQAFFDTLHSRDQRGRNKMKEIGFDRSNSQFARLEEMQKINDSINQTELIDYIKVKGYPGGYYHSPFVFYHVLLHSSRDWLFSNYNLFISEIKAGRMDPWAFAGAMDRMFTSETCQHKPFNYYFGEDVNCSLTPELVFLNSCQIGLDPFHDNLNYLIYSRGFSLRPIKTPLYEYYKKNKARFNCSQF